MPDSGQLRSLPVDEVFILPRSGFVQQKHQVVRFAHWDAQPATRFERPLCKSLCGYVAKHYFYLEKVNSNVELQLLFTQKC
jgi:hypothetical protein